MKVVCEYCGCYVETDENTRCPHCVAELGSSIKAEKERIAKEEEAVRQREEEERQREAEVVKTEKHPPVPHEEFNRHVHIGGPDDSARHMRAGFPDGPGRHARVDDPSHGSHGGPGGGTHHAGMPDGGPGSRRA